MMDQQVRQKSIKEKRFSIIIAAYNIENYIERSIESVENQTFKDIQIIVVNDCATDGTEAKILALCDKYKNIDYLKHEQNKRLGAARNTGLQIVNGEYIIFLDGDDYLAGNDVLEKLDKLIGKDKTDVTYLGFKIEGDREEYVIPTAEQCTKTYKAATDKYPNVWSKCWRTEFINENNIRFPEYRLYEDVLFNYKGVMKSKTFKIADFVTHKYISGRAGSITTKIGIKNIEDTMQNLRDLMQIRNEDYTEEVDIIIKKEIKLCKKRLDDLYKEIYKNE